MQQLQLAKIVNSYILKIYKQPDGAPFHHYLHVLALLAKKDIHVKFETEMFAMLFEIFQRIIAVHQNLNDDTDYKEIGFQQIVSVP